MKQPEIVLVDADYWDALYLDGELAWEGHRLSHVDLLEELNLNYKLIHLDREDIVLPEKLKDLKDVKLEEI